MMEQRHGHLLFVKESLILMVFVYFTYCASDPIVFVSEMRDCACSHLKVVCIGGDAYLRGEVETKKTPRKEKLFLTALLSRIGICFPVSTNNCG